MAISTLPRRYPSLLANDTYTMGIGVGSGVFMYPIQRFGPYAYENWLFCVCVYDSGPTNYVTIFRSVDNGLSWVESDTANRKSTTPTTSPSGYTLVSVCRLGHLLYVAHNNVVRIDQFDMNFNLWGAVVATGGPTVLDSGPGGSARIAVECRTDGSFAVMYSSQELVFGLNYGRVKYVTLTGGVWSGVNSITSHSSTDFIHDRPIGMVRGASNRIHIFFGSSETGDGTALFHVSLSSSNSLDTYAQVGGSAKFQGSSSDDSYQAVGSPIYANSLVMVPFLKYEASGDFVKVATATSQANPTFTNESPPHLTNSVSTPHYCPHRSREGALVSLSAGGTSIGVFHATNDTVYNGGVRYLNLPIANADSGDVYLFCVVGGVDADLGYTLSVYSKRSSGDGSWGNPVEVYSEYNLYGLYVAPVDYCITAPADECIVIY